MKKLKKVFEDKPHYVLSVLVLLCFITFISNFIMAFRDGVIDSNEFHQLLSTADGFETVVLFIMMLVLKGKKK